MAAVRFETDGEVAIVTIDRPEVRNAVDGPTAAELAAAFRRFDADDSLAVAILSKPVVAAVEGHAVAGGLELALWCDLRVAARDAVFGVYCRRWGVPLVDGGTVRLPRLIGMSQALDLILTGRGVAGDEALRIGLANRLTEPGRALEEARTLAHQIAAFPQRCLRSDRRSAYLQWDLSLPEALRTETELGNEVIRSGETRTGAARFAAGAGRHGRFE
jgi:enoyl-CoA hydratase